MGMHLSPGQPSLPSYALNLLEAQLLELRRDWSAFARLGKLELH